MARATEMMVHDLDKQVEASSRKKLLLSGMKSEKLLCQQKLKNIGSPEKC